MTLAVIQASIGGVGVERVDRRVEGRDSVGERCHLGVTNDREHPLHAVVEPHTVAIVREHAELDDRVVARIGRSQSHLAR